MSSKRLLVIFVGALGVLAGGALLLAQGGPQPVFGQLTATPAGYIPSTATAVPNVLVGTQTVVRFSVAIPAPTLNPTTVVLEQVDSSGHLIAAKSRLYDDGTHSDTTSGDKVFAAELTIAESGVARTYFRVGAAFRGSSVNAWSSAVPLDIDPFKLPPDPGDAGKQPLQGVDSDQDGVRDDVQRYIYLSFQDSPTQNALTQLARGDEEYLSATDLSSALLAAQHADRAVDCLRYVQPVTSRELRHNIEEHLLNTPERLHAFLATDRLLSGQTFVVGAPPSSASCNQ